MEKLYKNFKVTKVTEEYRKELGAPNDAMFFFDDEGRSWYDVMYELDETGRITVGYMPDGYVSFTSTKVAEQHGCAGLSMAQVDSLPEGYDPKVHQLYFDEAAHSLRYELINKPQVERSKEDIMKDLMRLQAELEAM